MDTIDNGIVTQHMPCPMREFTDHRTRNFDRDLGSMQPLATVAYDHHGPGNRRPIRCAAMQTAHVPDHDVPPFHRDRFQLDFAFLHFHDAFGLDQKMRACSHFNGAILLVNINKREVKGRLEGGRSVQARHGGLVRAGGLLRDPGPLGARPCSALGGGRWV